MLRARTFIALLAALLIPVAVATAAAADQGGVPNGNADFGQSHEQVCPGPAQDGTARCNSDVVTDGTGKPLVTTAPNGYGPASLQNAYGLTSASANAGTGKTVAIVDAYDDPTAQTDLDTYRNQYGLKACDAPCFTKVNQSGGTSYPRVNAGWAQEISLDLDMVSAICPNCKILLVEASSNSFANLAAAVDEAAKLGASAISNSYGGNEYSGEVNDQSHFNHPGIAITASSGDSGYGVEFPAASQYVTAVGGTSLKTATNTRGWSETAWSGAGSGCSQYMPEPTWQTNLNLSGCSNRMVADVSADADPNTGVAVYDSTAYQGRKGWLVFGGTSVGSPIIASVYALAGNADISTPYSNTSSLFDVVSGSNGSCSGSYLCTAVSGYDGPTGLGTPNGTGAF